MSWLALHSRVVEPEILDGLPALDPRALASRNDLVKINRIMGTTAIQAAHLKAKFGIGHPRRVIELGAGDARSTLKLARLLGPSWKGVHLILLDRHRCVNETTRMGIAQLGWTVQFVGADVLEWLRHNPLNPDDVVLANLFLHHFDTQPLRELFKLIAAGAGHFVTTEPRRWKPGVLGARALRLIGCNGVTCNDAVLSVRAGFAGRELENLWPRGKRWQMEEREASWSVHFFAAHLAS
jgi:SAM-dependent methyltransferase